MGRLRFLLCHSSLACIALAFIAPNAPRGAHVRFAIETDSPPATLDDVCAAAADALGAAIDDADARAEPDAELRLRIDALVPGLNPALASCASVDGGNAILAVLTALAPVLARRRASTKFLFPSAGDAAGAAAALGCGSDGQCATDADGGDGRVALSFLAPRALAPGDDALVFVRPINAVGDAVVLDVEATLAAARAAHAARAAPRRRPLVAVLLNPELGQVVALGIQEKDRRDAFVGSFGPAFYFRNLVRVSRASAADSRERGALAYRHRRGGAPSRWELWAVDAAGGDDGGEARPGEAPAGSLNRYMVTPAFAGARRGDATRAAMVLADTHEARPTRSQTGATMDRAAWEAKQRAKGSAQRPWWQRGT